MIKSLRPLLLAGFLLPLALSVSAAPINTALSPNVEKALKASKLQDNALSLVMIPLTGPGTPTVFNADVSVNPASTMKLVTTYAALEMLGPNHQWKTEFYTDGTLSGGILNGNLYLKGGGDPKLNMEKLWLLMRDLRANGVTQVTGDLVLDKTFFVQPQLPEFNDDGNDDNKPFLVKPDSLLVNLKALRFVARNDSGKVLVSVEPPIASIRIDNQVKALNSKQCTGGVRYNPVAQADGSVTVTVGGQLGEGLQLADLPVTARPRDLHRRCRSRDLERTGRQHSGQGCAGANTQRRQGPGPGILPGPGGNHPRHQQVQ
ncbi:PBP4 family serine-type D-alanyl-D-alanine carboxypeptidase [Pseudomonas baetica]|nr:PBP4 family serine-type D-alanyl-D-alanine carboxypeptidase [Pseudomonas baetica]